MPLTSAIIDKRSSDALLALAFQEGLVWTTEETDGVFERICKEKYDQGLQTQLLEQLVLTPKLSLCGFDPNVWAALAGPFREQHLANLDAPTEDSAPLQPLPVEMISGLTGNKITEDAMRDLVTRVRVCQAEELHFERVSGKKAPDLMKEQLTQIIGRAVRRGGEVPSDYSDAELEAQRRRNAVYRELSPIINAMQEYARLAKLADKFGLLVRTPILDSSVSGPALTPDFNPGDVDAEVAIFRIVAHQLGRTTYRPSLAGSLELANESATQSLREMLPFWYARLAEGDEQELRRLQTEINLASAALKDLYGVRTLGKITTWLALPVSAIEMLLSLPPVLGTTVSLAGFLAWRKDDQVTRKYRWASYGGT
jgi:hypothetical protein